MAIALMANSNRISGMGRTVTEARQSFTFTRRAMVLGAIQGGIGMLLAGRMAWISIAENEHYELLSESNRVNLTLVPPRRGWIVDRYGKPLANNKTDFRVDIIPDRLHHKEATIASLANLLSLDTDEVDRVKADLEKAAGFQAVEGADKLDYAQYRSEEHTYELQSLVRNSYVVYCLYKKK